MMRKQIFKCIVWVGLFNVQSLLALTLSQPGASIPEARGMVGVSYGVAGVTIGNDSVPMLLNRIHLRFSMAPSSLLSLGIEGGVTQVEVGGDTLSVGETIPAFHGKFGFSAGANLHVATPYYFNDLMSIGVMATGTYFMSPNEFNARYGGYDIAASIGPQFHIKKFGYLSFGPRLYLITGQNFDTSGTAGAGYSNSNNLTGWLALDFFPKSSSKSGGKPFMSLEVSLTPSSKLSDKIPLREIAISVSIGTITKRLYGEENDVEWNP